jgi:hypothetical protein
MAVIETIDGGDFINVEAKVGKGGINGWSDVVVVQAFLKFVEEQMPNIYFTPGEVPEPDGIPSSTLNTLILKYQKKSNKVSGRKRLSEDSVVGKARGKASWAAGKMWTIADLNFQCEIISLAGHAKGSLSGDYIQDLKNRFTSVRIAIGTPGISF